MDQCVSFSFLTGRCDHAARAKLYREVYEMLAACKRLQPTLRDLDQVTNRYLEEAIPATPEVEGNQAEGHDDPAASVEREPQADENVDVEEAHDERHDDPAASVESEPQPDEHVDVEGDEAEGHDDPATSVAKRLPDPLPGQEVRLSGLGGAEYVIPASKYYDFFPHQPTSQPE